MSDPNVPTAASYSDPAQRWLRQAESDIAADAPLPAFERLLASAPSSGAVAARLSGGGCGLAQVAAHWGRTNHLRRLLAAGCPAQLADNDGDTALIEAAAQGHADIAAALLATPGVEVDLRNRAGCTALHAACERKQLSVARLLLERGGARPDLLDAAGNSAMHALAARLPMLMPAAWTPPTLANGLPAEPQSPRHIQPPPPTPDPAEIAELMLELSQGTDSSREFGPDQENGAGYTPLMKCVATGHWSLLPHLLRRFSPRIGWANRHGVNLAHVFHSHHDDSRATRAASALLSRCLGAAEWRDLCAAVVASGPYGGYACLHFACEFRRLNWLPNRLALSADRNSRGETFVDILARRRGLVDIRRRLKDALPAIWRQTLLLLDPALGSPRLSHDFGRARRLLAHLSAASGGEEHDSDRGLCQQPQALFGGHSGTMSYESGRRFWQTGGRENRQYPLAVTLLVAAVGEDSPEAFSSLLELSHLDGDWSLAFGRDLLGYLSSGGGSAALPAVGNGLLPLRPEHLAGLDWLDPLDLAVTLGRSRVVQEMLLGRTFDLIPSCLRVLLLCRRMRRVKHRCVADMRQSAQSVLVNALNCLQDGATSEKERRLIDAYVHGELETDGALGPTFPSVTELPVLHEVELISRETATDTSSQLTVLQLLLRAGCEEALSARCVRMLVKRRWRSRAACCAVCGARPGLSPAGRLAAHAASLAIFTSLLTVFLVSGAPPDSPWRRFAAVVLLAFAIDHLILGCLVLRWSRSRWPDLAGVWRGAELLIPSALQIISLVGLMSLGASGSTEYYLRLALAGSYLLLSIRWLYHLTVFRRTGPTVSILKTLIVDDLLPFLSIFALVTAAFGVFFHAVLSPGGRQFRVSDGHAVSLSPIDSLVEIYSRPLLLAFGEFQIDSLRPCERRGAGAENCSDLAGADCLCPHGDGLRLYLALFVHLYLFVNLALLNLLIAKFSLTVNTKVDQAFVIWNKHRMRMLCEYQVLPSLPPPLSAINLLYSRLTECRACCKVSSEAEASTKSSSSWSHWDGLAACQPYRRYLWLQACKFRNRRRSFFKKGDIRIGR